MKFRWRASEAYARGMSRCRWHGTADMPMLDRWHYGRRKPWPTKAEKQAWKKRNGWAL